MMPSYCEYCGMGYLRYICIECGEDFEVCDCNWGQAICDECLEEGDPIEHVVVPLVILPKEKRDE